MSQENLLKGDMVFKHYYSYSKWDIMMKNLCLHSRQIIITDYKFC